MHYKICNIKSKREQNHSIVLATAHIQSTHVVAQMVNQNPRSSEVVRQACIRRPQAFQAHELSEVDTQDQRSLA